MLKISLLIGGIFLVSEKQNPSGRGILIQHFKMFYTYNTGVDTLKISPSLI